jgi:cob(I)alamin adenosyltransferase
MTKEDLAQLYAAMGALRETSECLLQTQKAFGGDVADMAAAVVDLSETAEKMVKALGTIDELKTAVEQLGETMLIYPKKLAELFDAQSELQGQVGRYITDAAKQQSGIRQVDKTLREHLEEHERLKLEPVLSGQR